MQLYCERWGRPMFSRTVAMAGALCTFAHGCAYTFEGWSRKPTHRT